jgi:uncharacterized membrane protein
MPVNRTTNGKGHFWTAQLTLTNLILIGGAVWSSFKFVSTVQRLEKDNETRASQIEILIKEKADRAEMKSELESIKERQRNQFTRIGDLDERIDKIDQQTSYNKGLEEGRHSK